MPRATQSSPKLAVLEEKLELKFDLPDPEDEKLSENEFQQKIETAWRVCDRFDLQTDIWRGRILRTVRDREKNQGEGRGIGFLNWLKDREISKTQAYNLIELANGADAMIADGFLDESDMNRFSKSAFLETASSVPEVQQMVSDAAKRGDRITRREVRQLSDDWTAMTSELLPEEIRAKATDQTIPTRYLAPLVKNLEKLPEEHRSQLQDAIAESPDLDTLKQVTGESKSLNRYLEAAIQVQALEGIEVDEALEEALRLGCLNTMADLVGQAAQVESAIAKLYMSWKRLNTLSERLYLDTGSSTPHLRALLKSLDQIAGESIEYYFGDPRGDTFSRKIHLKIADEGGLEPGEWD
jgi:hypothetical protein